MKRILCFLLIVVLLLACGGQAFADYDVLYCRMCGRQIPTDSKVCPYCGVTVVHVGDGTAAAAKSTSTSTQTTQTVQTAQTVQNTTQTIPGPFNTTLDYNTGLLVNTGKVRVTKSPTSESVPYGGSCMFIAHAANATGVTWYIANEDGTSIATAYEAADNVSGLYVSGGNTDTLRLSGIPSWMNGYQVQACFTGDGGPVYTNVAKIWTYQETVCQDDCWQDCNWCYPGGYAPPPPPPPPPPANGNQSAAGGWTPPAVSSGWTPPAETVGANLPGPPAGGNWPPPPPGV